MPKKDKIYEIIISEEGLNTYRGCRISAETMGKYLEIDSIMTDFSWDEDINREVILYAKILGDISERDALSKLEDIEFIDRVDESKERAEVVEDITAGIY